MLLHLLWRQKKEKKTQWKNANSKEEKGRHKLLVADAGSRHHYLLHLLAKTLSAEEKMLQWAEDRFTTVHAARALFYPLSVCKEEKNNPPLSLLVLC